MVSGFCRAWLAASFFVLIGLAGNLDNGAGVWNFVQIMMILISWIPAVLGARVIGIDLDGDKKRDPARADAEPHPTRSVYR